MINKKILKLNQLKRETLAIPKFIKEEMEARLKREIEAEISLEHFNQNTPLILK